jgi:flagellar hook-associated protein 1 FlgK
MGIESGKRGLSAAQKGLDIVGQNLSNVGTPGYTRQRVDLVTVSSSAYRTRILSSQKELAGQGVEIRSISQVRDSFLDKRFRDENSDFFYYSQKTDILNDIANVMDEYAADDSGLMAALDEISSALQNISGTNSNDTSYANILRTAFSTMVQTLQENQKILDTVADQYHYDLEVAVDDINGILEKITGLNEQISTLSFLNKSNADTGMANELLDSRNLLLDELSQYGDIHVIEESDGSVTVNMCGQTVVEGNRRDILNYFRRNDKTASVSWQRTGDQLTPDSGSLKAMIEMLNGRGPGIQSENEGSEKGILFYQDCLDTLAQTLVKTVNGILPENIDETGNPVPEADGSVTYKKLLGALITDADGNNVFSADAKVTARNISISDDWQNNSAYVIPNGASFSNGNYYLEMEFALKSDTSVTFITGDRVFTGTFMEFITDCHNTCVGDVSFNQGCMDATSAITDELLNQRDSISGVSIDEESANMLIYQKSYQAISRLMTALDEALEIIINKMGLVGR